jgi:hypothetical protein
MLDKTSDAVIYSVAGGSIERPCTRSATQFGEGISWRVGRSSVGKRKCHARRQVTMPRADGFMRSRMSQVALAWNVPISEHALNVPAIRFAFKPAGKTDISTGRAPTAIRIGVRHLGRRMGPGNDRGAVAL